MVGDTTWNDRLRSPQAIDPPLLPSGVVVRFGSTPWAPNNDDRRAASLLHVELISRVATQSLRYTLGTEKAALASLHAIFGQCRLICRQHPDAHLFETIAWGVLNTHVRPFTARWHRRAESRRLDAVDDGDDFRLELASLRLVLIRLNRLLLEIRDGVEPAEDATDAVDPISLEMETDLPWGLNEGDPDRIAGVSGTRPAAMAESERAAIRRRRAHYDLAPSSERATGLALSGGGIRSATFALGVLAVLGRRGLLKQFDYMSSVSGGGYLGSFITQYLHDTERTPAAANVDAGTTASEADDNPAPTPDSSSLDMRSTSHKLDDDPPGEAADDEASRLEVRPPSDGIEARRAARPASGIGLDLGDMPFGRSDRASPAMGYIRQNCRYLASGSKKERWQVALAQVAGILNNLLSIAAMAALLVGICYAAAGVVAKALHLAGIEDAFRLAFVLSGGVAVSVILVMPMIATGFRTQERRLDRLLLYLVAPLAVISALGAFDFVRSTYHEHWDGHLGTTLVALSFPLLLLALGVAMPRLSPRLRVVGSGIARSAAPIFTIAALVVISDFFLFRSDALFEKILWVIILTAKAIVLNVNHTGLHRHYRDSLTATFLIQNGAEPGSIEAATPAKLSSLADDHHGPYPILNAALNVPASRHPAMRGRLTDFFSFTPHHCGSPVTGYMPTAAWETDDASLTLATAMAISGAAVAPQMGLASSPRFSFWFALLNVRLGYWLPNPGAIKKSLIPFPWLIYLIRELTGKVDETTQYLNLSDGGHIENLGIYELLRRRCKFILAIDGEQDTDMTFHGFANLQRLATTDLGVAIEIDLDDLRLDAEGLSRSHFQFCRLRYPGGGIGYLCYVKLSLTGNEGEFLRRFRLDEPSFPHHPTTDQSFSEARFEAYRSLGEHVGSKLFLESIVGRLARADEIGIDEWFRALGGSLLEPVAIGKTA